MNVFLSPVDEDRRPWYLALESQPLGHGADHRLYEITGVDEKTILRGREELADSMADGLADRVRNLAPDVL